MTLTKDLGVISQLLRKLSASHYHLLSGSLQWSHSCLPASAFVSTSPQHPQTGGSATYLVLTCHASHGLTVLAQCFSFSLRSALTSNSHRPGSCSYYTRPPDGDLSSEVTQTTLLFLPVLSLLSVLCHCRSSIFVSTLSIPEKKKKKPGLNLQAFGQYLRPKSLPGAEGHGAGDAKRVGYFFSVRPSHSLSPLISPRSL